MHVRLLGPVEASDDAGPVPLGALKQRHLLAALLFDGGHPTTFETLIDRLWGDAPPTDARGALYGYVARLRRALRSDAGVGLDRWSGGYTLRVPAGSVDLYRFRALVERSPADPAERLEALDEALGLWRGDALAGLPGDWAARAREGLARARATALADWATAALALGRPSTVIDRLTAAVAQDPLAEPVVALLMQALHRAGRTAEALDRYARTRALLADELGADPGQPLRDLHTELLLAESPAPAPAAARPEARPRSGPCLLPPDLPDFTGHDDQVAAVRTALQPASTPLVAIVSGQGGAGKTALAVHAGHLVRDRYPDGQVFVNVGGADPLEPPEALSRALRAIGVDDPQGNSDLRERVALYRVALAGKRVLVVVDDAVDARQVQPFVPAEAGSALLVTSRFRLTTVPATSRLELDVMTVAEARALLVRMIGVDRADADPQQTARLIDLCARLPLAIRVAGARLAARPHWTVAQLADRLSDERRRLDELSVDELEVRASLSVSHAGLRPRAQQAFRALGSLDPPDLTALTVAALLGTELDDADDLVEQLTDARLLDVISTGGGHTRYRMHDLVRLYATEQARADPAGTRAIVTRALSAMLHAVERLAEQLPVATPRLFHPAGPPGVEQAWADALGRIELPRWFDAAEPALIAGVERAAALDLAEPACALADALVFASFAKRNNFDGWERTHAAAAAAAGRTGDRHAEAAMECGIGQLRYAQDRFDEARQHFSAAAALFEATGDDRGQAVALNALGTVSRELGEHLESVPQSERARAMLERLGDDAGVAHAHYSLGFAHRELGCDDEAFAHFEAALERYRWLGHRRGELITERAIGLVHRARGELAEAERRCSLAHDLALAIGDRHLTAYAMQALAKVWIRQGRADEAEQPLRTALAMMAEHHDDQGSALVVRAIGELELARERFDPAIVMLTEAAARWQAIAMELGHARTLRDLGAAQHASGDHEAAHAGWSAAAATFERFSVRERHELPAWRERWGCHCTPSSAPDSTARSTRITLPPASPASSPSDQCLEASSANSAG